MVRGVVVVRLSCEGAVDGVWRWACGGGMGAWPGGGRVGSVWAAGGVVGQFEHHR